MLSRLYLTEVQIRFAVLSTVFAAQRDGRRLETEYILRGVDREMANKSRVISEP